MLASPKLLHVLIGYNIRKKRPECFRFLLFSQFVNDKSKTLKVRCVM